MPGESKEELVRRLKASVGKEFVFRAPDEVGRASIRQYALALGDFNSLYTNADHAKANGLRDVMAPPTWVCDSWQYFDGDIDERGELLGRGELRELAALRAGNDYEFFQPVHPDDVLTVLWKVGDVVEKHGRSGTTIFQEFEVSFFNQRDELLARSRETFFHRA